MKFIALILSLPKGNATLRMRAWRTLKTVGAASLADGVYLLPERPACREVLERIAADVRAGEGTAHILDVIREPADTLTELFCRIDDYQALMEEIASTMGSLVDSGEISALKSARKLRKSYEAIRAIDYFPDEAQRQIEALLNELDQKIAQASAPDEPHFASQPIKRLDPSDYQGRVWATRQRPWVDRLASAWLIRRLIDPCATLLWVASPADVPGDALGFDYDGATFTHTAGLVSFEVLAASFGLHDEAIKRIGAIVHFLDVGGLEPREAVGIETVLKGLRDTIGDDDALLLAASSLFDGLFASIGGGGDEL
jgi:hypothetical protein